METPRSAVQFAPSRRLVLPSLERAHVNQEAEEERSITPTRSWRVCEGSIHPVCTGAGTRDCGYDQVVLYEDEEVSFCDGQDNDCDGLTDEEEGTPCLCNPGARICKVGDSTKAQFCPPTGAGWVDEDCPDGTECMGIGECTAAGVFQVNVEVASQQITAATTRMATSHFICFIFHLFCLSVCMNSYKFYWPYRYLPSSRYLFKLECPISSWQFTHCVSINPAK